MDNISGIQRALDYVEAHLTDEIDFDMIAKQAHFSSFYFQKLFSVLCGFSLGDYIRMRRLSVAGEQLVKSQRKVIDVALDFGYETPESFTRAFSKFHGITPVQAKNGGNIKSFSRLSVKLILNGGNTMNYRIERLEKTKVICKRQEFCKQQELTTQEISAFWAKCSADGTIPTICSFIPEHPILRGVLGINFMDEGNDERFPYGIGAEYNGNLPVPEGFEVITIPDHDYAVFTVKGKMPDAFVETYRQICTEFFPQSEYEYGQGIEFEVYPSADTQNPDYTCEIWVSVK